MRQTNTLVNMGTNTIFPADVNFATARIIHRKGRDLATIWAEADALYNHFADNPDGADSYELVPSVRPRARRVVKIAEGCQAFVEWGTTAASAFNGRIWIALHKVIEAFRTVQISTGADQRVAAQLNGNGFYPAS